MIRLAVALILGLALALPARAAEIRVGSKKFTESVILAEIACDLARSTGASAEHRAELGGTRILWDALLAGEIDLYPEYTGTITREILAGETIPDAAALEAALAAKGIGMSRSLGFDDTYALGMMPATAARMGVARISDITRVEGFRLGFSNEFLNRGDGWPALRDAYGLWNLSPRGLDHDLAYRALSEGAIDAIDLYTTDAEIARYGIRVLEDDRSHFPRYDAVLLYRRDAAARAPRAFEAMLKLEGRIDVGRMIALNRAARLDHEPEAAVAAGFVAESFGIHAEAARAGLAARVWGRTVEHAALTAISLLAAILTAVPLGILAARRPRLGQAILAGAGVVQTIPSLALLVFMIPFLGIGGPPAVAALFLYSLLPILRNTATGLLTIPTGIRNSAIAIGLNPYRRLVRVELPLALPSILAGMKTAAVINVGTATLGALIGAGGYGQPILTGIRLDDFGLILEGAVPAAILALLVQGGFDLLERYLVPRGLRIRPAAM